MWRDSLVMHPIIATLSTHPRLSVLSPWLSDMTVADWRERGQRLDERGRELAERPHERSLLLRGDDRGTHAGRRFGGKGVAGHDRVHREVIDRRLTARLQQQTRGRV